MARQKEFMRVDPEHGARIYFLLDIDKDNIVHFVINLALVLEDGTSYDVYRVDTCHGFLHEQRFWQSEKKIILNGDYTEMFKNKKIEVLDNYPRWIKLFRKKMGIEAY